MSFYKGVAFDPSRSRETILEYTLTEIQGSITVCLWLLSDERAPPKVIGNVTILPHSNDLIAAFQRSRSYETVLVLAGCVGFMRLPGRSSDRQSTHL